MRKEDYKNIHPLFYSIDYSDEVAELQTKIIGDIVRVLFDMPYVKLAFIHELVFHFVQYSVSLFEHDLTDALNTFEVSVIPKDDSTE